MKGRETISTIPKKLSFKKLIENLKPSSIIKPPLHTDIKLRNSNDRNLVKTKLCIL